MNPFNTKLGAPASGYGRVGEYGNYNLQILGFFRDFFNELKLKILGFVTYSDVCWFERNNFFVSKVFDVESCSPYVYAGMEWISYENERSITCKTNYVKENDFGGVMIFSLNTDDYSSYCYYGSSDRDKAQFPLTRKINSILFPK